MRKRTNMIVMYAPIPTAGISFPPKIKKCQPVARMKQSSTAGTAVTMNSTLLFILTSVLIKESLMDSVVILYTYQPVLSSPA